MTRTLAPRVLWTASAAAAVGLGLLTVAAVDADAAPDTRPASATSSQASTPSSGSSSSSAPAPAASSAGEQVTVAGTVTATCDGGALSYAGAPAPGWWPDDSPRPGEVEFRNGAQELEVKVTCVDGTPRFFVEGPRDDGRGRGDDSPATSAPSTPSAPSGPTSGRGYDDSDGRVGGGHGSDGRGGDDD
jgi:hypothetical protein